MTVIDPSPPLPKLGRDPAALPQLLLKPNRFGGRVCALASPDSPQLAQRLLIERVDDPKPHPDHLLTTVPAVRAGLGHHSHPHQEQNHGGDGDPKK
ncbi:hypothetical protein [Streptomyces sp. NPDC048111]|uniref:hypothetical protein n=1 Tax=Streptomyces sp. NPDC048111 TaxID=3365500 RepID=UPI00370FFC33